MGALAAAAPILGLLAGAVIARMASYELTNGRKYFVMLQNALFAVIIASLLWKYRAEAIIISTLLFLYLQKTGKEQPIELAPFLAVPAALFQKTQAIIFLYFIPTGTLNWNENKKLAIAIIAYATVAVFGTI